MASELCTMYGTSKNSVVLRIAETRHSDHLDLELVRNGIEGKTCGRRTNEDKCRRCGRYLGNSVSLFLTLNTMKEKDAIKITSVSGEDIRREIGRFLDSNVGRGEGRVVRERIEVVVD